MFAENNERSASAASPPALAKERKDGATHTFDNVEGNQSTKPGPPASTDSWYVTVGIGHFLKRGFMKMRYSLFAVYATLSMASFFSLSAHAQTVTNLYSFSGTNSSGNPGLVVPTQGRDGKLYGTTVGPSGSAGSIFKITTTGKATQLYTLGSDGTNPWAGLTLGSDGNYYGTASAGGASNDGALFKISPLGTYTALHDFSGGTDGAKPFASPIQATDSNFYGVTFGTSGASTVYRYKRDGTFATIYNFDSAHGQQVQAPLTQGSDGNLYGVATFGGTSDCGTIFKLSTSGGILWTYSFSCGTGGAYPEGPLLQAADGNYSDQRSPAVSELDAERSSSSIRAATYPCCMSLRTLQTAATPKLDSRKGPMAISTAPLSLAARGKGTKARCSS